MDEMGGVVTRVGDETVGEMWSLYDGQDMLNEVDPRFCGEHPPPHRPGAALRTSSTSRPTPTPRATARSGRRTRTRTCCCTSSARPIAGIVIRGAKYETAAAYANQAFVKPTIANWGDAELSDYALGFIGDMGAPGMRHICRTGFAGRAARRGLSALEPVRRGRHADRLRRRAGAVGERALLPPHARGGVHPRDAAPLQRLPVRAADPALRRHADRRGAVQRAADRARAAAGGAGEAGAAGLLPGGHQRPSDGGDRARRTVAGGGCSMPNQSLLYTGRVLACSQLPR